MAIDMEGRIDSLLMGQRDICHRLREAKMEKDDTRESYDSLVRQVVEVEGMVICAMDRECNTR